MTTQINWAEVLDYLRSCLWLTEDNAFELTAKFKTNHESRISDARLDSQLEGVLELITKEKNKR